MSDSEIKEGDIFVCRWGYVDKIVDFYKVIKRTPKTVIIKKLNNKVVKKLHRNGPAGSNLVVPADNFADPKYNPEMRKKIQEDNLLYITDCSVARKWDGNPIEEIFGYY